MASPNSKDYASNVMRGEIVKKIMKEKGYTLEKMAELIVKEYPGEYEDALGAVKMANNRRIGDDWCEKLEKVLNLPKDTLKNIK